jgi:hypothetical protein
VAMDTVTYPDDRVAQFIGQHCVPVKVHVKEDRQVPEEYLVSWTPTVILADEQGRPHYRVEGYFPPQEFVARLSLGLGRHHLDRKEFVQARERFQEVAERHAGSESGAEALYWLGVVGYKESGDAGQLKSSWQRLAQEYPTSDWTERTRIPATSA